MSSHGSRASSRITDDDLNALILKLQTLLPQLHQGRNARVSATKVLNETCSYIRRLQKEVDDLSERLSQRPGSMDITSFDAEILRNLLQQ
ncbi:transcription factor PRE6-like [Durio zibethinus]|uniref:Transcription factor PRE6-like n=1 Tax=Durio zibethinus TaxID=66656 RepID=A0A6P6BEM8_DURZI|nr:transcription factor PRE6-like [Durio zibethinus]